jgi:hypothetical protein
VYCFVRRLTLVVALAALFCTLGCGGGSSSSGALTKQALTWATPAAITYGTALSSTQLNATANVPGTFSYSPPAGTILNAGKQTLMATFTPTDTTIYSTATASISLTVNKATPAITWNAPAAISFGTAVGSAQLNATANVPGTFAYAPAVRAVLGAGTQTLKATFMPADSTNYNKATTTVSLTVNLPQVSPDTATPKTVCTAPTPWPLPSNKSVVGDGTPASCTQAALRAAVAKGGSITFACGGKATIPINAEISVNAPTVIDGEGTITLDGGGISRIFHLQAFQSLSVRNLRFINGFAGQPPDGMPTQYLDDNFNKDSGGAIKGEYLSSLEILDSTFQNNMAFFASGGAVVIGAQGTLTVSGSVFDGNLGGYGGGIFALVSKVNIANSVFTHNGMPYSTDKSPWYPGAGGALNVDGAAGSAVSLCGLDVENNFSSTSGGGVSLWIYAPEQIVVDRSTFANNRVWPDSDGNAKGGGLSLGMGYSDTKNVVGTMLVKSSSFLENTADVIGGGLNMDCDGGPCSVTNSTFYENTAYQSGSDFHNGGWGSNAWTPPPPYVHLDNNTFAYGKGNSVSLSLNGRLFIINNSVFLENGPAVCSLEAPVTGSNVLEYSMGGTPNSCISGSILNADPELADLADNGGPTLTMLPSAGSPVIGAGSGCESTDQRGEIRNTQKCTIGAVEAQ